VASSDSLVYVESVDANSVGSESPLEHLRKADALVRERGHPAESLVRTASGQVLTPPEFSDVAFDACPRSGRAVVARGVQASRWGMPDGADYVAHHWTLAPATDPQNFSRLEMPPWAFACVGDAGDSEGASARPATAYGNVRDIRISPDGHTVLTLQFCRDQGEHSCLFSYDLATGEQRLLARLDSGKQHGDLSVSPDGRFALAAFPLTILVDLQTGHWAGLGKDYRTAAWYPAAGPSCVLAVTGGDDNPPWRLVMIDLSTFSVEPLADLPRRTDGLQVARDGTIAARMRPEGETGWFDELMVSTDNGSSFEPVAPLYGASGWRRRSTRPRWIEPPPADVTPVALHPGFDEFLHSAQPSNILQPGELSWVLDTAAYLIRHRVQRLRENPPAADALLTQLRVLASLGVLFDQDLTAAFMNQALPVMATANATGSYGREAAADVALAALGEKKPPFTITFGPFQ
jgi:hypothetical protein